MLETDHSTRQAQYLNVDAGDVVEIDRVYVVLYLREHPCLEEGEKDAQRNPAQANDLRVEQEKKIGS